MCRLHERVLANVSHIPCLGGSCLGRYRSQKMGKRLGETQHLLGLFSGFNKT